MSDIVDHVRDSIARLTPEQRAELESRLNELRGARNPVTTIVPRPDQTAWPLSAGQRRIWTLSRVRPHDPVYNMQRAWRLRGSLDPAFLAASLGRIVQRHEALRARFTEHAGQPVQDIRPIEGFDLPTESMTEGGGEGSLAQAMAIARTEAEIPFDLSNDMLIRGRLLSLARDDHVFVLTAHHLVCDGWSMDIIERELTAAYADLLRATPTSLEPLPIQFADFAIWQEENRQGAAGQRDLDYWANRLEAPVAPLEIPHSSGSHRRGGPHAGHLEFTMNQDLSSAIKKLSREAKVTPFMTLLSGFQLALHHATGQQDLVLCAPAAGRIHLQTEPLVGYFNNLVVLRGDLSGDPTVQELLDRNRTVVLEAFDHQGTPFQDIAALPAVASVPLARGLFVLQETSQSPMQLPDVVVTPLVIEAETADFELAVFMREVDGRYRSVVRFHRNLVGVGEVETLMTRFESVLSDMIERPNKRRSELVPTENRARSDIAISPEAGARPRNLLESMLVEIWEQLFRRSPISIHDDFFDLGGHSLLAAELIAEIEQKIVDEPMPLATLLRAPTIAELADVIAAGGWSESWASLVPIQPEGSRTPLFFVHAHGGNVIAYRFLARRLGDEQPFYGLQAPETNLDGAAIVPRRIEKMAAVYIEEMRTVQRHGPYLLGGWCLGGDVAYEMANQLTAAGEVVAALVMVENPRPEFLAAEMTNPGPLRAWNRVRTRLWMEWSNLVETPLGRRPRFVLERLSRFGQRGLVATETFISRWVRIPHSRAYRWERIGIIYEKAYEEYHPPSYSGPTTLVRAEQQPHGRAADPSLGWAQYIEGEIQIFVVPGHRNGLLLEPRVGVVAEQIRAAMAEGLAKTEGSAQ